MIKFTHFFFIRKAFFFVYILSRCNEINSTTLVCRFQTYLLKLHIRKKINRFFTWLRRPWFRYPIKRNKYLGGNNMVFNNFKEFVTFVLTGTEYEHSWRTLYLICARRAHLIYEGKWGEGEDELVILTSTRLLAPLYEMFSRIELVGVYSNEQIGHLENEMVRIIEEAVARGLLNGSCVPEEEVRKYIDISPEMARLLWPKKTRELMDIRDALASLVP